MHFSNRSNNSRSSDAPGARPSPTPHHDRTHRDRPSPPLPSEPANRNHGKDTDDPDDPPKPKGKLGSYQMRQNLQFNMETPKFLQQLKAQVGGNTSTRFTGAQSAGDPDAKRRRAIQGESELDDDGPLVVMPDDGEGGETMGERDLERLRVLHPNAVVDGVAKEEEPVVEVQESRAGPPVDPRSGKLLFQAKSIGSHGACATSDGGKQGAAVSVGKKAASAKPDKGRDNKGSTAAAKGAGKKKKGGSHLLSFDE